MHPLKLHLAPLNAHIILGLYFKHGPLNRTQLDKAIKAIATAEGFRLSWGVQSVLVCRLAGAGFIEKCGWGMYRVTPKGANEYKRAIRLQSGILPEEARVSPEKSRPTPQSKAPNVRAWEACVFAYHEHMESCIPKYITNYSQLFVDKVSGKTCILGTWSQEGRWLFYWNSDADCWTSWRKATEKDEAKVRAEEAKILCIECGKNPADLPSKLCVGCAEYRYGHQEG